MGQTKRQGKQYSTPNHPWEKERIIEEKELTRGNIIKKIWEYIKKHNLKNFIICSSFAFVGLL